MAAQANDDPVPSLELTRWAPLAAHGPGRGVGVTIINFNTAAQTLRCVASLRELTEPPAWVVVLDNASAEADWARLAAGLAALPASELRLYRSRANLGFAAGSNALIGELLKEPACRYVGLLNNDAVAEPSWASRLVDALEAAPRAGLAGARMHKLHAPGEVDTLGIALYASLMPADRKHTGDAFLGPTGGCAMATRELLQDLHAASGYWFDARYFCYCEDTDLVLRARLLGWQPAYVDERLALHEGQASTGAGYSAFITYHGIRNLVWMHCKLVPRALLLRRAPLLLLAHALTIVRHLLAGQPRLLWRLYRDAWAGRKEFRAEHRRFQQHVRISPRQLAAQFVPRFYRGGYARLVLAQLRDLYRRKLS